MRGAPFASRWSSAVYATSRSCTIRFRRAIASARIEYGPIRHIAPFGSISCPWRLEVEKPSPATAGPLQRLGSRVQSQTQPASALSGSIPASLNVPQPQEKTVGIFISAAT